MINENALRDTLLALAEQDRTQYIMSSAILDELQALREAVRGLDPTFSEVMAQKKKEHSTAKEQIAVLQLLSGIIQRLEDGEVC